MVEDNSALLLPASVVEKAKRIADAIRAAEVAPLIGAGTSVRAGLPTWNELVDRIISAWHEWSPPPGRLSRQNRSKLLRQAFEGNNLSTISYLRSRINEEAGRNSRLGGFGQVLYSALYSRQTNSGSPFPFTPEPDHVHRHLVSLFRHHPRRLWTTNYDDLLEEAAQLNNIPFRTLDPDHRQANGDLLIAHVHGFLAPPERADDNFNPGIAQVVLAEDDYHAVSADVVGWTNREMYRLFDEHRVLIIGMSLTDPNLRRVLSTLSERRQTDGTRHFAVITPVLEDQLVGLRVRQSARAIYAQYINDVRSSYWQHRGIEIVDIPDHDSIPLGVIYVTTSTVRGTVFDLQPRSELDPGTRSLDDLYAWLAEAALILLDSLR